MSAEPRVLLEFEFSATPHRIVDGGVGPALAVYDAMRAREVRE